MIKLDLCPACRRGDHRDHVQGSEQPLNTAVCPCTGGCKDLSAVVEMEDRPSPSSALDLAQ